MPRANLDNMIRRSAFEIPNNPSPEKTRCIKLIVPDEPGHLRALAGAIKLLSMWNSWVQDGTTNATDCAKTWKAVLASQNLFVGCDGEVVPTFEEFVEMVQFREDCDCNLFYKCCDGTEKKVALSDIVPPSDSTSGNEPKPAAGGIQQYCKKLYANGKVLIPTPLNTGDVVEITSTDGSGSDGQLFNDWYCADGSKFWLQCGSEQFKYDSADPMPGEHHMSLILQLGASTYVSLDHGAVTIPSGISNQIGTIQVNDSALANNPGSYDICFTVQNNQLPDWTHVFDFAIDPGAWILAPARPTGSWSGGAGWIEGDDNDGGSGNFFRRVLIDRTFPSTHISRVEVVFDYAIGAFATSTNDAYYLALKDGAAVTFYGRESAATPPSNGHHDELYNVNQNADFFEIYIATDQNTSGSGFTGSATIIKVVVTGTGVNPFI